MKTPKVSILIPTYNYARFLPEAIESALRQDYPDFEVVVVDDCSPDDSAAVIRRFADRDRRVRGVVNSPNRGMVQNWNYALELAQGELIKFVFGDDLLCSPDALNRLAEPLVRFPQVRLSASARKIIDDHSRPTEIWDHLGKPGIQPGLDVIVRCFAETRNLIGEPSAVMFRKSDATRGFDPRYRQVVDLEFWMHLLEDGDLFYIDEPLCGFRVHGNQQTAVNRVNQVGEREQLQLLVEYYEKPAIRSRCNRMVLFNNIYRLRRNRGDAPASEIEQRLLASLGAHWYRWCWAQYKALRPWHNLRRSVRKRFDRFRLAGQSALPAKESLVARTDA